MLEIDDELNFTDEIEIASKTIQARRNVVFTIHHSLITTHYSPLPRIPLHPPVINSTRAYGSRKSKCVWGSHQRQRARPQSLDGLD